MRVCERIIDLHYYDVDRNRNMSPRAILRYMAELAAVHNDSTSSRQIDGSSHGWMLNKWKVKIQTYPRIYDRLKLRTWISKIDRFFVAREFAIEDEEGQDLVVASSLWVFIDMEKRRPARLDSSMIDYDLVVDKAYFRDYRRFARDEELDFDASFKVRRADIDINNHVNNLVYFDWILETIPEDIYLNSRLLDFEIDYKKELRYPDKLSCKSRLEAGDQLEIVHGIYNEDGELNLMAVTNWTHKV